MAVAICGCSGAGSGEAASGTAPPSTLPATSASASSASAASAGATSVARPCGWRADAVYRHVVWIWMENRTYAAVLGSGQGAPRLASYGNKCGAATNYVAITHPSLPNYLAATSGSTGGVTSDCGPDSCPQSRASLFGQLPAAGLEWRSYVESMPGNCVLGSSDSYATKHNPAVYFTPVRSQCRSWDVPMGAPRGGAFAAALAAGTLPAFSFVTPNLCNDGHDCSISHADGWLGSWLDTIATSPAYAAGDTVVFVTWDEGVGANQHIATVVIAPSVPAGSRVSARFDHYSLLRTTEELLGLPLLGGAQTATSMRAAFHL